MPSLFAKPDERTFSDTRPKVLFDGFDPLDVIAPYDVLWAGGAAAGGALTVELVSADGPREVTGEIGGLVLRATAMLDPDNADLIIVPGAAGPISAPEDGREIDTIPILLARTLETGLPALMRKALDNPRVTVATVCGGSLALAMAGLLDGRHAVTRSPPAPRTSMPMWSTTATWSRHGGVTSGLDLGLYLLEREFGPRIARSVEEMFAYERRGTVWRDTGLEAVAL